MNGIGKIKDIVILGLLLILAIWLSPFILIGVISYLAYRAYKIFLQKKLFKEIRQEWFSKNQHIFFLYSDSKKWKDYFEKEIIPKIQSKASVWNWSTRQKDGWNNNSIEAKILKLYRPIGFFYPMAFVILPSGQIKIFQFYQSYVKMLKSGNEEYKRLEKEFLKLADSL